MKNYQKFCRQPMPPQEVIVGYVHTSSPGSSLASVAERLTPSAPNPKVPGSNPGADLFFLFWVSPGPPQGLLKASPGPSRLLPLREQQPGVEHGSVRTRVRPPAAARAVENALTHYHTNVWLYS